MMLEPPAPAGSPFTLEQQDESTQTQNFDQVCVSLVERGWKIMPKKGTYPINKPGPHYINLVDPRGNRKTLHVFDEKLWGKLRSIEASKPGRSKKVLPKNNSEKSELKTGDEQNRNQIAVNPEGARVEAVVSQAASPDLVCSQVKIETAPSGVTLVEQPPQSPMSEGNVKENVEIRPDQSEPVHSDSLNHLPGAEDLVQEQTTTVQEYISDSQDVETNTPLAVQSFVEKSATLQKSIFELGFETLLVTLQSISLSPVEVRQKVQDWSADPKSLIEFVRQFRDQPQVLGPDSTEKDTQIARLQANLREAESELQDIQRRMNEM